MNQSTDQPMSQVAMEIGYDPDCGIAIKDVPDRLPRRNGKKVNFSTVWRWATKGYSPKNVRIFLETTLIGRSRYTSRQALRRFNRRRNALDQTRPIIAANLRRIPKTNTAAKRYLKKEGFPTSGNGKPPALLGDNKQHPPALPGASSQQKGLGHGHGTDTGRNRAAIG